jgi:hypothetical protein
MVDGNRAGDRLIVAYPQNRFELMRDLNAFESVAFISTFTSAVRHLSEHKACRLNLASPELGMRAGDHVGKWDDGDLYLTRHVSTEQAWPVFSEVHADPETPLLISTGTTADAFYTVLHQMHPIRQAMRKPASFRRRGGAARGAAWYLSRGREVPPLQLVAS